jgi:hypothetical protein
MTLEKSRFWKPGWADEEYTLANFVHWRTLVTANRLPLISYASALILVAPAYFEDKEVRDIVSSQIAVNTPS